jgi:hypothetical protein
MNNKVAFELATGLLHLHVNKHELYLITLLLSLLFYKTASVV